MQTPQRPFDGDGAPDDGPPSYEWLDEWLCEYVDGTMDPSVEAVFEKYVEANPELKAHVERLRQTRELLCGCELAEEPPTDTQAEVCREVEDDLLLESASLFTVASKRPMAALGMASSVAVALVVGFLAGSMFVEPAPVSAPSSPSPVSTMDQQAPSTVPEGPPLEGTTPILQSETRFAPGEKSTSPPSTAPAQPSSGTDTVRSSSPLTAVEAR